MDSWEDIRATLDLVLRGLAAGLIGLLGYAVTLLLPIARAWLAERITASAVGRLTDRATEVAAQIVDPNSPISNVAQQASEMASTMPQAMANAGVSVEAVGRLISRKVSEIKVGSAQK